ncbi:MAG: PD-(D/E)XK nuclease family protein, partial [Edaphobacter sp.]
QEEFTTSQEATSASPADDVLLGNLAAVAAKERPAMLERLPLGFLPGARFEEERRLSYGDKPIASDRAHFERPEGSFEARALGNAVHEFLEIVAKRLARGASSEEMLKEVAGWEPRISSVLRGDGLAAARVGRLALRVRTALENTLRDAEGLWVLGAREEAASEFALTSWADARRSVRLDRIFRAGATPLVEGDECLWIVDYKTTTHGREGVDAFLAGEREKYDAQIETYARTMKTAEGEIRVGLYYPMLPRLVWWVPKTI